MIRIEPNNPTFALTNDQLKAVVDMVNEHGWDIDYDIVEHDRDNSGIVWLWVHDEGVNPTRYWIEVDGQISLAEEVTWDWKGTDDDND